mmetsp:Transcript_14619/g.26515  ORF Transcript_14619/g.26515 Transcript_14619/m.26515 type:complete len:85 (-) Transcript_14619:275-529(-)
MYEASPLAHFLLRHSESFWQSQRCLTTRIHRHDHLTTYLSCYMDRTTDAFDNRNALKNVGMMLYDVAGIWEDIQVTGSFHPDLR